MFALNKLRNKIFHQTSAKDNFDNLNAIYSLLDKKYKVQMQESLVNNSGLSGFEDEVKYFQNLKEYVVPLKINHHKSDFSVKITDDGAEIIWPQDKHKVKSIAIGRLTSLLKKEKISSTSNKISMKNYIHSASSFK